MTKDDFRYYLPYSGTILIVFGTIKQTIFFSLFNVNVTSFLELSETVTLFFNDLLLFATCFVIFNIVFFLSTSKSVEIKGSESLYDSLREISFLKRIKHYYDSGPQILLFTILCTIGIVIILVINYTKLWIMVSLLLIGWGAFLIKVMVLEGRRQYFIKYGKEAKILYSEIIIAFILLLIFTIGTCYSEYNLIKTQKRYLGTQILLSDKTIISDSSYYYIGKTKNYVFFFNEKAGNCDIFPMSEIKVLSIKKNSK